MFNYKIKTYLDRLAESPKRPNSYLFFGPDETGKEEAAFYFVSKILGKEKDEEFLRRAKERVHPDIIIVEPEIVEDKRGRIREKEIVIGEVRQAQEQLKYFPYEFKQKFCLIKKAQKMNAGASNSLLKILEEPTASTFFILLADDIDSVLPTVASRCTALRFVKTDLPVWKEENRERLRKIFTEEIYEKFEYAEEIAKDKNGAIEVLIDWESVMAEGLRKLVNRGNQGNLGGGRNSEGWKKARKIEMMLQKNREAINRIRNTNANTRTVLEEFLLDMRWG